MDDAPPSVLSDRYEQLVTEMDDPEFRHSYGETLVKRLLARQMKDFRGDQSQAVFADVLDEHQSRISDFENPNYGRQTLQTCFKIAEKLDVFFIGLYVSAEDFIRLTDDIFKMPTRPHSYDSKRAHEFARLKDARASRELAEYVGDRFSLSEYDNDNRSGVVFSGSWGQIDVRQANG